MWRHIASNALTLFIVALIALAAVIAWGQNLYRAAGPLEEAICLKVEAGSNMTRVSEELLSRGAIANGTVYRLGARYSELSDQLKRGSFLVPARASMQEIVDIVTRGGASTCGVEIVYRVGVNAAAFLLRKLDPASNRFVTEAEFGPDESSIPAAYLEARADGDTRYRVTVAEGATVWQVVTALRSAEFLVDDGVAFPVEGVLAPDSYEVRPDTSLSVLLAEMAQRQADRLATAWQNRVEGLPIDTPEEALILASIVEKETGLAEERRQVASVFINRLRAGMRLQSDPTVIYGVTAGQGTLGRGIRQSELRGETPYNTYVIDGLPPTPIANPGLASIEAVLDPAETDFLFFVADETGGHAFAATLDEHNRNVARWREVEANKSE